MIEYENLHKVNHSFFAEYKEKFQQILQSGWYILGNNVAEFEANFATYLDTKYCIGVANGLDALTLALKAYEFADDAEVIVPSNTYIATIISIINAGLTPVLVEPDIHTYNIDVTKIEEKISPKTRAIMIVHLYGKACEMSAITALCQQYNLKLIEDCAQSHGAMYKNQKTGTFGDFGCFSFYPTKNLGALGDAGAVVCRDEKLAQKVRSLRNYGSVKKYHNELIGINSRLDEMQAGFLNIKLPYLNKIAEHKRNLAHIYFEELSNSQFILPVRENHCFDVYHIFNIRHPQRNRLQEYLRNNNIQTEIHYPVPPHRQKALEAYHLPDFPISEIIHNTTLSLPISYFHTAEEVRYICQILKNF